MPGYVFQEGECIYPSLGIDPNCAWYVNSFCNRCYEGYALINYFCSDIDPNCTDFDQSSNTCRQCKEGIPMGPSCV